MKKSKLEELKEKSRKRRLEKAKKFADELVKKLGDKVICVVVWGSVSRGEHTAKSDIDVFVVLDDTKLEHDVPFEIRERIRLKILELAKKIDKRITLQYFAFLTDFWDDIRNGEPLVIDVLRLGIPVYDVGVFMPAKRLLLRGRIYSTKEAAFKKMNLAKMSIRRMEDDLRRLMPFHMEQAITSSAQSPIMAMGRLPPGKFEIPRAIKNLFVKNNLLEEEYVKIAEDIQKFADKAEKGEGKITGKEVEEHLEKAKKFIERMEKLLLEIIDKQRFQWLFEDYKMFLRANVAALKSKGITPPEKRENLPETVKKAFNLTDEQMEIFSKWEDILEKIKDKKEKEIDEKAIYDLRRETREFIRYIGKEVVKDVKNKSSNKKER